MKKQIEETLHCLIGLCSPKSTSNCDVSRRGQQSVALHVKTKKGCNKCIPLLLPFQLSAHLITYRKQPHIRRDMSGLRCTECLFLLRIAFLALSVYLHLASCITFPTDTSAWPDDRPYPASSPERPPHLRFPERPARPASRRSPCARGRGAPGSRDRPAYRR